jgi:hypothetical protein
MDCQTFDKNTIANYYCQKQNNTDFCEDLNNLRITSSEYMLNPNAIGSSSDNCQVYFNTQKRIIEHLDDLEIKQSKSQFKDDKYLLLKQNLDNIKEKEEEYFKEENNMFNSNKSLDSFVLEQEFNKLEKIYTENSLLHKTKFVSHNVVINDSDQVFTKNVTESINNYKYQPCSRNVSSLNTHDSSQENSKKKQVMVGSNVKTEVNPNKSPRFQETQDLEILNEAYFGKTQDRKENILKENKCLNSKSQNNSNNSLKHENNTQNVNTNNFNPNKESKFPNIKEFFNLVSY